MIFSCRIRAKFFNWSLIFHGDIFYPPKSQKSLTYFHFKVFWFSQPTTLICQYDLAGFVPNFLNDPWYSMVLFSIPKTSQKRQKKCDLLSFWSFLVFSADNANLSIWSCRIRAQFFNWSMIFHGVVIATHNSTVLSVKLSSVNAKRNKFECSGSPSNIQCPSRVWSENKIIKNTQIKNLLM